MAMWFSRFGVRVAFKNLKTTLQPAGVSAFEQGSGSYLNAHYTPDTVAPHPLLQALRLYSESASGKREREVVNQSDSEEDSDSDNEVDNKEKGVTEFWRRKMRTFHGILDLNKDGVISFDDLQILVDRFVDLGHLSPHHEQEFNNIIKRMWEERWGSIDPYNMVTTERYLEDMHHIINDKQLRKKVHTFLPYLFKALDKDKSGRISVEEYKLFFQCLGMSSEAAVVSFSVIDENNDGQISMKEFVKLGREFFLSEDHKSPSKMFWGPLTH